MPNPRLATRYAKSLMDLAIEKGQLEKVYADMEWLKSVTKSNRDFVNVLRSPVIKADTKLKIVEAVTKERVSEMSSAFIQLMIRKGRESFLPEITGAFITQYKIHKEIYTIKLTTAVPVGEEIKNTLLQQIRKTSHMKNIELETIIDPGIIGGFVLQADDQLIDGSIAYDLRAIAKQFENNDFIYKIR